MRFETWGCCFACRGRGQPIQVGKAGVASREIKAYVASGRLEMKKSFSNCEDVVNGW